MVYFGAQNGWRLMRVAILLFCCALGFGQDTSPAPGAKPQAPATSSDQKSQNTDFGLGMGTPGRQSGALDILSDTQGVDFGPYLQGILKRVRENWYHLIPESVENKKGKLAIELAITPDGKVARMKLVATSGDLALDRPAWGSITASNPFPALPSEFKGQFLALRLRFYYSPEKSDLEGPFKPTPNVVEAAHTNETAPPATPLLSSTSAPSKSGVVVSISSSGDSKTTAGEARIMTPTVTGTEKQAVKWNISGQGCSNSSCGVMVGNLYLAPNVPPIPNEVNLTAVSEADPSAKATVIVRIQEPTSKIASKP